MENINNKLPNMIMLVGLSGSGKSYYSTYLSFKHGAKIQSSDKIREEILGDENSQSNNELVFNTLHNRIKTDLKDNKSVIYDSCNISYKRRKNFLESLNKIPCNKIVYFIATPYKLCLAQNKSRDRFVPEEVINRMYKNIDIPAYFEGWDDIQIMWNSNIPWDNSNSLYNIDTLFNRIDNFNQDNPHHTLTLGGHCKMCHSILSHNENLKNENIIYNKPRTPVTLVMG